ncbi:FliM/FliN family flagellar motor C-terminal domain-containing protein [Ruegeria arenilitoris]|uniref:FliM/FliN family flagellar motor C-terminal domain-containing protein n=1 Tax=Ruegeria arenilitoris TaxID=1173585 RepID=UPI00147B409B|nr:FliM/FliN family flagellar motor C-terminal domain-containing protein [Ruegeria arenilitoris]
MSKTVSAALARKLSAGQEGAGSKSRALLRALRLAIARAAVERFKLSASVIGAKQARRCQEVVTSGLEDGQLFLLFATKEGRVASVVLDVGLVSAVIQKQTMGEVFPDLPQPRALTDTDAAMVVPLVEDMLERARKLVDDQSDAARLNGYEFASRAVDRRTLSLALVEDGYDAFEFKVELEGGVRQGTVLILLPEISVAEGQDGHADLEPLKTLSQAAGVVRAELNAVICRMHLPLTTLSELGIGDLLPLAGARLDRIDIAAIDRTQATTGRLGQCGGQRAVRINEFLQPPAPTRPEAQSFVEHKRRDAPAETADFDLSRQDAVAQDRSHAQSAVDEDFAQASTDRLASEISELAGLPAPAERPND